MNNDLPHAKPFQPNADYMIIHWKDLESALRLTAHPERHPKIRETVKTLQVLNNTLGPERAVLTMVAGIAWLTNDG